jgi:hypothetical protein
MSYDNASQTPQTNSVPFGTRADILPNVPLPDFNATGGPTYAAKYRGNEAASDLMAVLCNTGLPARLDFIAAMRSIDHPSIVRFIDSGVVQWPHDNARYYTFAYQRPLAPRLKNSVDERHQPMSEDTINHYFVRPLIGALLELQRTGIVHHAIRPTNIFWRMGSATPPQLGDCMSVPAGYGQPVLFEPLERALCTPIGRGPGMHADDCYAFGVTLALMFLGENPLQGLDDQAIIQAKVEKTSFGCLVGTHRLPATHIELLRGLLMDDARQRWSASDLEQWLTGRRLTPKNSDAGRRASRGFNFIGKDFVHLRPLAVGFSNNVAEAAKVIENGVLDKWLRRALDNEDTASRVETARTSLKESGKTANFEEQLIARVCIALDPPAPIRYRGIAVMPLGIADMMVEAVMNSGNTQILAEIIGSQLVTFWIEMQEELKVEFVPMGQQFERMKGLIEKNSFGNGIERVMYELSPGLPCLSPTLRSHYVTSPKLMLPAFERIATSGNRPREPMDRHIAAYLIVRDRRSELLFDAMTAPENSPKRGLALLTLFSEMQNRHGPDALPALAQWLLPLVEPSMQRFLSKVLKEKLRTQIKDVAAKGDLGLLLRLLDDPKRVDFDQQEFMAARMLYLNILKEINMLEANLANREHVTRNLGKPMAASISTFVAILLVLAELLRAAWQALIAQG